MAGVTPFISQRSVQLTLDSMLYGRQPEQPSPLENLVLVGDFLSDPAMPNMEMAPIFALHRLLIDLISQEFATQCRNFNFDEPTRHQTQAQALQAIAEKSPLRVPELIGWMLLYYRYVRSDLNILTSDLLEILSVDARTLRRYQANAVKRLTGVISLQEWSARQEKQTRYLYSQLPAALNEHIWGREELLDHARSIIVHNVTTSHLLITGSEGVGKTSFVQAVVQNLIDDGLVDQLVWITEPKSMVFVRRHLKQVLLHDSQISLKEYCLLNRLVVVLDDIRLLNGNTETEEENLFHELSNATLLVTNIIYRHLGLHFSHLVLSDLDKDAVASIVEAARLLPQSKPKELTLFATNLYEQIGGNPTAIKLAVNNLVNLNLQHPLFAEDKGDLIHRLLLSSYEAISQNAELILLMFALFPVKPVTLVDFSTLWTASKIDDQDLITLLSCGLLTRHPSSESYILPAASRRFVHWLYSDLGAVRGHISSLVEDLLNLSEDSLPLDVVEHILLQEWLDITPHQKQTLAEVGVNRGLKRGNYAKWAEILERLVPIFPGSELKLFYAICLRQLADFSLASDLFYEIIEDYGRAGAFQQQGTGILELGILFRQQGLYEQAITLLERARSILKLQQDPQLHETDIEIAQALIDLDDTESLKAKIPDLSVYSGDNPKVMILLSEVLLHIKDYGGASLFAERAAKYTSGSNLGRVYATLGRITAEQKDFSGTQHWFELAISLLEQESDAYGLARAKSNLAAAFIAQRQFLDDAEELLLQAQATQRLLNDRAGMIYTKHNIEMLNRMKWIDES